MATETMKRSQTMSILEKLRTDGVPRSARYRNEWTGEELPASEEEAQDAFQEQKAARVERSLVNKLPEGPTATVYKAMSDVGAGPTGASPITAPADEQGMIPYSPAEYERRSKFSPTQPPAKRRRRSATSE